MTNETRISPSNTKGNARQRCICERLVQMKSKFTMMFYLDLMVNDA